MRPIGTFRVVVSAEEVVMVVVQESTCTSSAGFVVQPVDGMRCLGGP